MIFVGIHRCPTLLIRSSDQSTHRGYDYTLDESGVEKDESTHKQEFTNNNAKIGVKALAMLSGFRTKGPTATPENPTIKGALRGLMTPFLANMLADEDPVPLLKLFNANTENPYLLWENATRAELTDFVEAQQEQLIKTVRYWTAGLRWRKRKGGDSYHQ